MESVLTALADCLARQSWQVAAVFLLVAAACYGLRKASAHWRYLLWLIVLAKCLAPGLVGVPLAVWPRPTEVQAAPTSLPLSAATLGPAEMHLPTAPVAAEPQMAEVTTTATVAAPGSVLQGDVEVSDPAKQFSLRNLNTRAWLAATWCVGVAIFTSYVLLKAWVIHRRLRLTRRAADPQVAAQLAMVAQHMAMDTTPAIYMVDGIVQPFVWGWFRGSIYVPQRFVATGTAEQQRTILAHELAHVARWDAAVNLLQIVVQALFFFHPLVWWANRQIRRERENCCDETVIAGLDADPRQYGQAIVDTLAAEYESNQPVPSLAVTGRLKNIEDRIERILSPNRRFFRRPSRMAVVTVFVLAACLVPTALVLTVRAESTPPPATPTTNLEDRDKKTRNDESNRESAVDVDPKIQAAFETALKRVNEYAAAETLTIPDGQPGRVKLKSNPTPLSELQITSHDKGASFEVSGLDAEGKLIEGIQANSGVILHKTAAVVIAKPLRAGSEEVFCVIVLQPKQQGGEQIEVEVKVVLAKAKSAETAPLLAAARQLQVHADMLAIFRHCKQRNLFLLPENLAELNERLPKDVYSPRGEDYHFQRRDPIGLSIASCGPDGVYGNDDDDVLLLDEQGLRFGRRQQLHPEKRSSMAMEHGECSLAGKVIDETSGKPVSASLMLFYLPTFQAKFAETGADGEFIFRDIPDGAYFLHTTNVPGYLPADYDPQNRGGPNPQFSIAKGEQRSGIVLKVQPAYRISGKVLEPDGKPCHKSLRVYAWTPRDEYDGYDEVFGRFDSSKGTYVVDGLNGKPVYVSTAGRGERKEGNGVPLVYYPSTYCRDEARLVQFDQGRNVEDIDISLRNDDGLKLTGTVHDEAGEPIPEAFMVIHHRDMTLDVITTYTDEQGQYELSGLGEGEFLMHVDAAHRGFVPIREPIDIDKDTPTTHHDFELTCGAMVFGRFVDKQGNPWEIGRSGGWATVTSAKDLLRSPMTSGLSILMLSQTDMNALVEQATEPNEQKTESPTKEKSSSPDKSSRNKRRQHAGWTTHDDFRNKYRPKFIGTSPGMSLPNGEGPHSRYHMMFPDKSTFVFQALSPGYTKLMFLPKKVGQKVAEIRYEGRDVNQSGLVTKPGQEIRDLTIVIDTGE